MTDQFSRIQLNFGAENIQKLKNSRVAVFGVGGVGGYAVEALVRSGIGSIDIIDDDKVVLSNLNRQIIALHSTIGMNKVDAAELRIHDINPECKVYKHQCFYLPSTADQFNFSDYDYVVDCIDTVSGKIQLVLQAKEAGVPIISSMGAGNKVDPSKFEVADIYSTDVDPLSRVMRHKLKELNVKSLKVVYSKEIPLPLVEESDERREGSAKIPPGSNAFVPSVAGLLIAAEVIKDLTDFHRTKLPSVKSKSKKK